MGEIERNERTLKEASPRKNGAHYHESIYSEPNYNGFTPNNHEYSRSMSYSQRQQIKQHHSREESKQQIPTIHETANHPQYHNTMDSLKSIPPIPSINGNDKRSYNKYRDKVKPRMERKKNELITEWKTIQNGYKNKQCKEGGSMRN